MSTPVPELENRVAPGRLEARGGEGPPGRGVVGGHEGGDPVDVGLSPSPGDGFAHEAGPDTAVPVLGSNGHLPEIYPLQLQPAPESGDVDRAATEQGGPDDFAVDFGAQDPVVGGNRRAVQSRWVPCIGAIHACSHRPRDRVEASGAGISGAPLEAIELGDPDPTLAQPRIEGPRGVTSGQSPEPESVERSRGHGHGSAGPYFGVPADRTCGRRSHVEPAVDLRSRSHEVRVMMTSTHALVGACLGAGAAVTVPELSTTAVLVGFVGGALPDADLLATHRRTTHFPLLAPLLALPVLVGSVAIGTPLAILVGVFALAVAVHSPMDAVGGGVEPEPWLARSDRGVYDHLRGRWIAPRRWVRYAGAPEDMVVASVLAIPAIALADGFTQALLLATLAVSLGFVSIRRRLADLSAWMLGEARAGPERGD